MEKIIKPTTDTEMTLENMHRPPETAEEMVNCFGTYEIQPTADRDDMYPTIAQGFNKKIIKTDRENEERQNNNSKNSKNCD